jgi:RNase P subunit RPR2
MDLSLLFEDTGNYYYCRDCNKVLDINEVDRRAIGQKRMNKPRDIGHFCRNCGTKATFHFSEEWWQERITENRKLYEKYQKPTEVPRIVDKYWTSA